MEQQKAMEYKRFDMALSPIDKSNHSNEIIGAIKANSLNSILCIERYGKELKMYNENMEI